MSKTFQVLTTGVLMLGLTVTGHTAAAAEKRQTRKTAEESTGTVRAVLWRNPVDISSRNLLYGPGGKKHLPHGRLTFIKEELGGSSPKFEVRDDADVKWKVKLGDEARSETVASRLVWAVGYVADEDYFLPELKIEERPAHLRRGQKLVSRDGRARNARLKRRTGGEEKLGYWHWKDNPFKGTREFNGLRVMMALINNWDLKDDNNSIVEEKRSGATPTLFYFVRDLGASFGTTGHALLNAKDHLHSYERSNFIEKAGTDYVNFGTPSLPALIAVFNIFNLPEFIGRTRMRPIGDHIPRADARWIGQILARLSPAQIRDAFRGAGYSPVEVDGFARVLERRIAQLNAL